MRLEPTTCTKHLKSLFCRSNIFSICVTIMKYFEFCVTRMRYFEIEDIFIYSFMMKRIFYCINYPWLYFPTILLIYIGFLCVFLSVHTI